MNEVVQQLDLSGNGEEYEKDKGKMNHESNRESLQSEGNSHVLTFNCISCTEVGRCASCWADALFEIVFCLQ